MLLSQCPIIKFKKVSMIAIIQLITKIRKEFMKEVIMFNRRKYLILVISILAFSIVTANCTSSGEPTRDLSTPSTRLVGHWGVFKFEGESRMDLEEYFGVLDSYSVGSYIGFSGDSIYNAHYRVLSESEATVTIEIFVGSETLTKEYEIAKDGKSMKSESLEYQYIDTKTEP
jgi:hypothetical protein